MAGQSKNNPSLRGKQKQPTLVYGTECEKCEEKCTNGKRYLQLLNSGKAGKGLICIRKSG